MLFKDVCESTLCEQIILWFNNKEHPLSFEVLQSSYSVLKEEKPFIVTFLHLLSEIKQFHDINMCNDSALSETVNSTIRKKITY